MRPFLAVIAAAALCLAGSGAAVAHPGHWYWSLQKAMQQLDGKRVHVGARTVRLDSATALCSGAGRAVRQRGTRAWKHFDCTYSLSISGRGLHDCEFRLHVLGVRKYTITNARWIGEPPRALMRL